MSKLLQRKSVLKVKEFLQYVDQSIELIELEETARTAVDAASSLNKEVGAIVKSLLFSAGDNFVLCLVSGDKRCSLRALKKFLDEKDVSMASPDDVKKITGYTIGGVSPVGHLSTVKIYIDTNLERFTTVFAAAGHPNCVFKIQFNQLVKLTSGEIKEIAE